jgi:hypothetical protein
VSHVSNRGRREPGGFLKGRVLSSLAGACAGPRSVPGGHSKPRAWRQRPVPRAPRQSGSRPPARAARPRRESPSRRLEAPGAGREQACRPHGGSARRTGCTAVVLAERAVRSPLGVGSLRLLPEQDPGEALASELAVHRPQVRQRTLLPGQWRGPRKPPRLERRIIDARPAAARSARRARHGAGTHRPGSARARDGARSGAALAPPPGRAAGLDEGCASLSS